MLKTDKKQLKITLKTDKKQVKKKKILPRAFFKLFLCLNSCCVGIETTIFLSFYICELLSILLQMFT